MPALNDRPQRLMVVIDGPNDPTARIRGLQYEELFRQEPGLETVREEFSRRKCFEHLLQALTNA